MHPLPPPPPSTQIFALSYIRRRSLEAAFVLSGAYDSERANAAALLVQLTTIFAFAAVPLAPFTWKVTL
jgi:hypothetical protein